MVKKALRLGIGIISCMILLCGCEKKKEIPQVNLSVWCAPDEVVLMEEMAESFRKAHADEAIISFVISEEDESTCKDTVLQNVDRAADVFLFAADQFEALVDNNALLPITRNVDVVIEANGGKKSGAVQSAMKDGTLYAYPVTASNGYFMYYNSAYFSKEDVLSMDKMLEIAAKNGKKVSMDLGSGWYLYSFFKGAGLNVSKNKDGVSNNCNWNSKTSSITGVEVAQAILDIANHPGFLNSGDDGFVEGIMNGTIIAGINGTWNSMKVEEAFGINYEATKLPCYTVAGKEVQMCSFAGYKYAGIKASTKNPEWAMQFAEWITNEDNQVKRFMHRGEGPTNMNAVERDEVKASKAMAAFGLQSEYSYLQNVADSFWNPTYTFGTTLAAGNPDQVDLQQLLDDMVKGIIAK